MKIDRRDAGVAELVDALDLGSSGAIRGGSSPFARTTLRLRLRVAGREVDWRTKALRRRSCPPKLSERKAG